MWISRLSGSRVKGIWYNTTCSNSKAVFPKKNKLPQVGFEPSTLGTLVLYVNFVHVWMERRNETETVIAWNADTCNVQQQDRLASFPGSPPRPHIMTFAPEQIKTGLLECKGHLCMQGESLGTRLRTGQRRDRCYSRVVWIPHTCQSCDMQILYTKHHTPYTTQLRECIECL